MNMNRGSGLRRRMSERGDTMIRVRIKDLALVAFAGGLLAFEVVSLGGALPGARRALADRGLLGRADAAPIGAAGVTSLALERASSTASRAIVGAVKDHAHQLAASTSPAQSKRCVVVTRARNGQRAHRRAHLVTVKSDGSCAVGSVAQSLEMLREVEKAVDLALKHATL